MQAIVVTQATTVTPATSNIKDDSNIMTAHNSRNASNSRNESNNRAGNTVWTPSKAGMLLKTEAGNSMEEAKSSRYDNRNITVSTEEGRPATTRIPEIVETSQQQY
jgi:hypothetical protein